MKLRILPLFLALSTGFLAALSANGLELEIRFESAAPEPTDMVMTTKIQDGKIRTDLGDFSSIVNTQSGEVISLMHPQRMFLRLPGGAVRQVIDMVPSAEGAGEEDGWKLEPTGRKEVISGMRAEEFAVTGQSMLVWLTRDISPSLTSLVALRDSDLLKEAAVGWPKNLEEWPGFPVKVVSTDPKQPFTVTILRLQEKAIDASEFAPPATYQTMEMPPGFEEMMRQMPR
jgi:hypothetical protein